MRVGHTTARTMPISITSTTTSTAHQSIVNIFRVLLASLCTNFVNGHISSCHRVGKPMNGANSIYCFASMCGAHIKIIFAEPWSGGDDKHNRFRCFQSLTHPYNIIHPFQHEATPENVCIYIFFVFVIFVFSTVIFFSRPFCVFPSARRARTHTQTLTHTFYIAIANKIILFDFRYGRVASYNCHMMSITSYSVSTEIRKKNSHQNEKKKIII